MTLTELETLLRQKKVFDRFGLSQLGVFGSFARNEPYNDIDFLLEQDQDLNYTTRQRLKRSLQSILKIKIDLVPEKFADPIILYRARKDLKYVKAKYIL
jgi:predicted nucleotidyltransferase